MELEDIMLSEISQRKILNVIPYMGSLKEKKTSQYNKKETDSEI